MMPMRKLEWQRSDVDRQRVICRGRLTACVQARSRRTSLWCSGLVVLLAIGCDNSTAPRNRVVRSEDLGRAAVDANAVTGTLAVTVFRNVDFDPNGFSLSVDGGMTTFVPAVFPGYEQTDSVSGLSAGTHILSVSGVAGYCAISASAPRSFLISAGATTQVSFAITCGMLKGSE